MEPFPGTCYDLYAIIQPVLTDVALKLFSAGLKKKQIIVTLKKKTKEPASGSFAPASFSLSTQVEQ